MNTIHQFISQHLSEWILDGIVAVMVLFGFYLLFHYTRRPLKKILHREHVDEYLVTVFVDSIYRSIIVIVAITTALSQVGINVLAALTGFGIAGIAIGFAAKDTLGNIIAGFSILWDRPFRVGDWIDADGHFGQVQVITLRTTRIYTSDNFHIIIPNQAIANSTVVNHHHTKPIRKKTYFYLPVSSDWTKAQSILVDAAMSVDSVLSDPGAATGLVDIENGLVKIGVVTWASNAEEGIGQSVDVREAGLLALQKSGFANPYPVTLAHPPVE